MFIPERYSLDIQFFVHGKHHERISSGGSGVGECTSTIGFNGGFAGDVIRR